MDKNVKKQKDRARRKLRGRKKISGTAVRPRLCVYRSNANWYAQLVDDVTHKTIVSTSTLVKGIAEGLDSTSNAAAAVRVGTEIGKLAVDAGIKEVVFDKNGFRYHGRVKALADAAREAGLKF